MTVRDAAFTVATEPFDFSGFWSRMESGAWEPETLDLLDRWLAPGSRFVDRTVFETTGYASGESTLIKIDVEGAEFLILPRLDDVIAASRATWYVSFHELNVNPAGAVAAGFRADQMRRSLRVFQGFRWHDARLRALDPDATLRAVDDGTWPPHASIVFSRRDLAT